jgi:uncharacterized repeat protein (TIGR03803 family)
MKPSLVCHRVRLIGGLVLSLLSIAAQGMWTEASAQSQTLTTLHSFIGSDGAMPYTGLISDASGALYGTTAYGGAFNEGTVFKLTPPATAGGTWTETVLYNFTNGNDGAIPYAGLTADASGALYGAAFFGGAYGAGTVFKLTPTPNGEWAFSVLYTFTGGNDGANPNATLISDATGALYGTTVYEGGPYNNGTVFELTPPATPGGAWTETVLHSFGGGSDGANPYSGLIFDASGALYGTTYYGGGYYYAGTLFQLTPPAAPGGIWTETVLHTFSWSDGAYPYGTLIADASGALYGTTANGGLDQNYGTVFQLTPPATTGGAWTETVLYRFTGGDGANPYAGLISDASGVLYGTASGGGAGNSGTVFKLTPPATTGGAWTETVLHSFTGGDGAQPIAGLMSDASGALYGANIGGGANNEGTVFKLPVPATFVGVPGQGNCLGQSISLLAREYGGIAHAAAVLGYATVTDLHDDILGFCGG